MVTKPIFGNLISIDKLESLDDYILTTIEEPWQIIQSDIQNKPNEIIYNLNMDLKHLEYIAESLSEKVDDSFTIVGLGGGSSCDTAKYLAWKFNTIFKKNLNLILIPSIISVDAFLCSSIAVRINNKVNYIGESDPESILIDFDLIKKAPKYLNRAGVSDTISITSALGDWKLEREEVNGRFDKSIFNKAKKIALNLMKFKEDIRDITNKGIRALVNGFYEEVALCEKWGDARPEEGSEHFLAYCIESITHDHYIHGNIIGLNILISLFLQNDYAEFSYTDISEFFHYIMLDVSLANLNLSEETLRKALNLIQDFVLKENLAYSIYNSPKVKLDKKKVDKVITFINTII